MGFGDNFYDDIIDEVLEHKAPIVLDADIFKSERLLEFLEQKERDIVLTPHPKEFVTLWRYLHASRLLIYHIYRQIDLIEVEKMSAILQA